MKKEIQQGKESKTATTKGKMRTFIAVRGANGNAQNVDYKDSANHAIDQSLQALRSAADSGKKWRLPVHI